MIRNCSLNINNNNNNIDFIFTIFNTSAHPPALNADTFFACQSDNYIFLYEENIAHIGL